jgi:hypothetical protein
VNNFQDWEVDTSGRFQAQVRKAASGREQPNDTVLLDTGCFQYRQPELSTLSGSSQSAKAAIQRQVHRQGRLPIHALRRSWLGSFRCRLQSAVKRAAISV